MPVSTRCFINLHKIRVPIVPHKCTSPFLPPISPSLDSGLLLLKQGFHVFFPWRFQFAMLVPPEVRMVAIEFRYGTLIDNSLLVFCCVHVDHEGIDWLAARFEVCYDDHVNNACCPVSGAFNDASGNQSDCPHRKRIGFCLVDHHSDRHRCPCCHPCDLDTCAPHAIMLSLLMSGSCFCFSDELIDLFLVHVDVLILLLTVISWEVIGSAISSLKLLFIFCLGPLSVAQEGSSAVQADCETMWGLEQACWTHHSASFLRGVVLRQECHDPAPQWVTGGEGLGSACFKRCQVLLELVVEQDANIVLDLNDWATFSILPWCYSCWISALPDQLASSVLDREPAPFMVVVMVPGSNRCGVRHFVIAHQLLRSIDETPIVQHGARMESYGRKLWRPMPSWSVSASIPTRIWTFCPQVPGVEENLHPTSSSPPRP